MPGLYERIAEQVAAWRSASYPSDGYPAIQEILEFARDDFGELRFLRPPQLHALETYWYLRLKEGTPHTSDLYAKLFGKHKKDLLEALGISDTAFAETDYDLERLWETVRTDDEFARKHQLHALRESLLLDYPSYILALAMGAGKTFLIGAIIATEFAMAQEYPDGPFIQNALIFAPGKTIIESLRQLNALPFREILPPRMFKSFAASLKLTFTRDGERDIPVIRRSTFNVVVTNTEKIRIQKEQVRKSDLQGAFSEAKLDEARAEVANDDCGRQQRRLVSVRSVGCVRDRASTNHGRTPPAPSGPRERALWPERSGEVETAVGRAIRTLGCRRR